MWKIEEWRRRMAIRTLSFSKRHILPFENNGLGTAKGPSQEPSHMGEHFSFRPMGACHNSSENGSHGESGRAQGPLTKCMNPSSPVIQCLAWENANSTMQGPTPHLIFIVLPTWSTCQLFTWTFSAALFLHWCQAGSVRSHLGLLPSFIAQ